jgi:hypothetical protein
MVVCLWHRGSLCCVCRIRANSPNVDPLVLCGYQHQAFDCRNDGPGTQGRCMRSILTDRDCVGGRGPARAFWTGIVHPGGEWYWAGKKKKEIKYLDKGRRRELPLYFVQTDRLLRNNHVRDGRFGESKIEGCGSLRPATHFACRQSHPCPPAKPDYSKIARLRGGPGPARPSRFPSRHPIPSISISSPSLPSEFQPASLAGSSEAALIHFTI